MDLASSTIFVTEAVEPGIVERKAQTISNLLNQTIALKIFKNGALCSRPASWPCTTGDTTSRRLLSS